MRISDWSSDVCSSDLKEPVLAARAEAAEAAGEGWPLDSVRLLAPILYPPAIYCAGANYMDHAREMSAEGSTVDKATTQPYFFLKSQHCVIGPNDPIRLPKVSNKADWEAAFAVVNGRPARNVPVGLPPDYCPGTPTLNHA